MAKFKINETVFVKSENKQGVIKAREVKHGVDGGKRTKIEYIVRFGEGFENWKAFPKEDLVRIGNVENENTLLTNPHYFLKIEGGEYKGYTICMYAETEVFTDSFLTGCWEDDKETFKTIKTKMLRIGYSICSPEDKFDEVQGLRIARHRMRTEPFCHMQSNFTGEFNVETIDALMRVKADYIIRNAEKFITKNSVCKA